MHIQQSFNPDIQGLRAVAVVSVFAYHLFPTAIPGGFVGVDVFFVISGYLITGLLLKDLDADGRVGLLRFYGRRVKRLLPAATAVLVTTGALHILLPASTWENLTEQIVASALYYQNWWLGFQSVDYLGSEAAPGPLQHFWSLAVEEQYYIVWPVAFLCISFALKHSRHKQVPALRWSVAIILLASLLHSITFSHTSPEMAYFASTTRAWELALGGVLNFFQPELTRRYPLTGSISGMTMIIASCFLISPESIFPGYVALLPTVGASLVIVSSNASPRTTLGLLKARPVQYLGDISYSLYLWHWPVIIFFGLSAKGHDITDALVIIALALALAHLSKRYLEDPFRRRDYLFGRSWPLFLALLCIGVSLASAAFVHHSYLTERGVAKAEISDGKGAGITPSPLDAHKDRPELATMGCHTAQEELIPRICTFGEENSSIHLALIGDSHALQWAPAFREIAEANDWQFTLLTKSACAYAPILVGIGSPARAYDECLDWTQRVTEELNVIRPSHVVIGQSLAYRVFDESDRHLSTELLVDAYAQSWRELMDQGINVIVIRDTPRMTIDAPECLTTPGNGPEDCFSERLAVLDREDRPDPLPYAAERVPGVRVMDLSDHICNADLCPSVTENILIWRDRHHLTATFVKWLKPALAELLARAFDLSEVRVDVAASELSVQPSLLRAAASDLPAAYGQHCFNRDLGQTLNICEFGSAGSEEVIALIGDSRAAQWSPTLIEIAEGRDARLVTLLNSSCPLGALQLADRSCTEWANSVMNWIKVHRPDHVVISQSRGYRVSDVEKGLPNASAIADAFLASLEVSKDWPEKVFVIADTPRLARNPLECLRSSTSDPILICATRAETALPSAQRPDPLALASRSSDRITLIDMNGFLCPATGNSCPPLIDGKVVWRTKYLLTASFAAQLNNQLEQALFSVKTQPDAIN